MKHYSKTITINNKDAATTLSIFELLAHQTFCQIQNLLLYHLPLMSSIQDQNI